MLLPDSSHSQYAFSDLRVRQAISYAIDTETICEKIGYGYWVPTKMLAGPGSWDYSPDVVGYPYNPEKARQLMAEAGYSDYKCSIFGYNKPQERVDVVTAIQGYLNEIGFDIEVVVLDTGRQTAMVVGGGWENGLGYATPSMTPSGFQTSFRFFSPGGILWPSAWRPPEYQEVLAKAGSEPDFEEMQALVHETHRLFVDEYCAVNFLWVTTSIAAKQPQVHDDGIYETNAATWTPADAWIER